MDLSCLAPFSAEPVGCLMLLEAAHTSDPSLDPAMVLFKSIIQINTRAWCRTCGGRAGTIPPPPFMSSLACFDRRCRGWSVDAAPH